MKPFLLAYIIIILAALPISEQEEVTNEDVAIASCVHRTNCADCIRGVGCSWCSQGKFYVDDEQPISRCNTTNGHMTMGCQSRYLFIPENRVEFIKNDDVSKDKKGKVNIKPQRLDLKLSPRIPVEIDVTVMPEDFPLDLYYLMDLTYTMGDDKIFLSKMGDQLGTRLQNLTKMYQQGFGSFIDKVTMPYVRMTPSWLETPCSGKKENCTKPYGFKHHLSLSPDLKQFSEKVNDAQLSASVDKPEGGLDALMQAMVCGEHIGWSNESRKVIIFATDAPFHSAGDGKLGGIIRPNDGKCHMNANGDYTHSTLMDYPSIAQLNHQSIQNSIIVIFAVTKDHLDIYRQLAQRIEGSKSALLSDDSSNIVELVVQEYQKITSTIKMSDNFAKQYINVSYYSDCIENDGRYTDVCNELPVDKPVKFRVKIELLQCPTNKDDWTQISKIYREGRFQDGLIVDLQMMCDCPCSYNSNEWVENSPNCGGKGTEKCGLCSCYPPFFGEFCQCNAHEKAVPVDEKKACMADNSTEVCSGRGSCLCGHCDCSKRHNSDEKYSGRFCECDNFSCEKSNGEICSNHGSCVCGECQCQPEFEGSACDCSKDKGTCVKPGSDVVCSGNGNCICGKCSCEGKHSGQYCEKCLHETCPTKCEELTPCVQCKAYGTGEYENAGECELKCYTKPIAIVEVISQDSSSDDEVLCRAEDATDQCAFYFVYDQTPDDPRYIDVQKTKECPPTPPIFWILIAIISIIVVVGVCLIIAWKVYAEVSDQREYARFEGETQKAAFKNTENPLYQTPVATYQNPMYGKQMKQ